MSERLGLWLHSWADLSSNPKYPARSHWAALRNCLTPMSLQNENTNRTFSKGCEEWVRWFREGNTGHTDRHIVSAQQMLLPLLFMGAGVGGR